VARVTLISNDRQHKKDFAIAAETLASRMPLIVMEARKAAATMMAGLHGRRKAGQGENFWQYRPFIEGEAPGRIDWRRSARYDAHYYVRENEWETAHTVHLFIDRSASMQFMSDLAQASKIERAMVLGLALADCLVRSGERVALIDLVPATAASDVIDRFADALVHQSQDRHAAWPASPLPERAEVVLISDCLMSLPDIEAALDRITALGARGHLVRIVDPVELSFPFTGDVELTSLETTATRAIGDADIWRATYLATMAQHCDAIMQKTTEKGWSFLTHNTGEPASLALLSLMSRIITR
jgi:uncharacterized protein (DUF58 family)